MKLNLSATQKQIVNHADGPILVKAGPGSGKTRVLIERIKSLLLTKKRCKILALTFSNLAAEEMKNRLLEDKAIEEFFSNVTIGTIHSFCLDIVQTRGNLIGLSENLVLFENTNDRISVLRDIVYSDTRLKTLFSAVNDKPDVMLLKYLDLISEQKKLFITPEMCTLEDPMPLIYSLYNDFLLKQNAMDFDDIIFYAYRIFSENPSVVNLYTSLYRYICVDEAQDLSFAHYQVLKALCGENYNNIMFVGDENQSIYGFNGSDSSLMTEQFVKDFTPTIYTLQENFRSAKSIVDYANRLEQSSNVSNYYYNGELKAYSFENELSEAAFITRRIKELMQHGHNEIEGNLAYDDFAIIARNKYVFREVENHLVSNDIPYYYKKSISGFENESDLMKAFELSTRLLINPKDIVHYKELYKLIRNKPLTNALISDDYQLMLGDSKFSIILDALKVISKDTFDFTRALQILRDFASKDCNEDDKFLIYNDITQWENHWYKYVASVQREYRSLVSFRNSISLGKTQDISRDNGVALLTAHMSKGLQFEVVFIIGLTEGTFPDYRAVNNGSKEMEQEKNNIYVAITRAKRLCYLTYPKMKTMPWGGYKIQNKSRFLLDLSIQQIDNH